MSIKTLLLTLFALIAFAGNSVLCRLALAGGDADPVSFTVIRLLSGALTLIFILLISHRSSLVNMGILQWSDFWKTQWLGPWMLFIYALMFSLAYIQLETGVGALILFATVQMTMIAISLLRGEKISSGQGVGILVAFVGFIYLMWPSINSLEGGISLSGFLLMLLSGVAWGVYTLKGRDSSVPVIDTAANFVKTLPLILPLLVFLVIQVPNLSSEGLWLAIASGAITSGLGYAIWYAALRGLSSIQAAVVQLLVPVIAALGGAVFVSEPLSWPFIIAASIILCGIALVNMSSLRR